MEHSERVLASAAFFLVFSQAITVALAPDQKANSVAVRLGKWKAKEPAIVFYGQVVDQGGRPVDAATVHVNAPEQTGFRKQEARRTTVLTSEDGHFEVDAKLYGIPRLRGSFLVIEKIEKEGCEYIRPILPVDFTYRLDRKDRFKPDRKEPVTFCVRRKADEPTFLIENGRFQMRAWAKESSEILSYNCIQEKIIAVNKTATIADLQLQATFDVKGSKWAVTLSPTGTNGGIIASNEWLAEAPENDYQRQYSFSPEDHVVPVKKYLYVRSREPAIYARIEIEYINANKEFFRLSGKYVTNPYGERNLEQATDLPFEVYKKLTDEAKAAFRKDKRPEKPDLNALIKAMEGKLK